MSPSSVYSESSFILFSFSLFLPPSHSCPTLLSFPGMLPFHFSRPVPQAKPGGLKQTQCVQQPSLTPSFSVSYAHTIYFQTEGYRLCVCLRLVMVVCAEWACSFSTCVHMCCVFYDTLVAGTPEQAGEQPQSSPLLRPFDPLKILLR